MNVNFVTEIKKHCKFLNERLESNIKSSLWRAGLELEYIYKITLPTSTDVELVENLPNKLLHSSDQELLDYCSSIVLEDKFINELTSYITLSGGINPEIIIGLIKSTFPLYFDENFSNDNFTFTTQFEAYEYIFNYSVSRLKFLENICDNNFIDLAKKLILAYVNKNEEEKYSSEMEEYLNNFFNEKECECIFNMISECITEIILLSNKISLETK